MEQAAQLDLRGVKCPLNFVKAKMRLLSLAEGERLLILLDDGEPIDKVPASLTADGYEIISENLLDEHTWQLLVEK